MKIHINYKKSFTNHFVIAIIYNSKQKEVIAMKVLYSVPVDVDELIFAGEITVPSDRWAQTETSLVWKTIRPFGDVFIL